MNNGYKDLKVWQKSMALTAEIYSATQAFPKQEAYGLTSQIRRSAISIPSNLAEGGVKSSTREFLRFIEIAIGSAAELETQLILSHNLNYLENDYFANISTNLNEINKMLFGLRESLKAKLTTQNLQLKTIGE